MNEETREIQFTLNGVQKKVKYTGNISLLDLLRNLSMFSVKNGCGVGDCGTCTVLMDGKPVRSCMLRANDAAGHAIDTLEGMTPHSEGLHGDRGDPMRLLHSRPDYGGKGAARIQSQPLGRPDPRGIPGR
jgi:xanthine dehydrogenase iron-sulfur cluster and FAD-binding subunit A